MKWIKFILGLCDHKWEILHEGKIVSHYNDTRVGTYYELQCEKCGDVEVRNLR